MILRYIEWENFPNRPMSADLDALYVMSRLRD